jgi:hypothetical protein
MEDGGTSPTEESTAAPTQTATAAIDPCSQGKVLQQSVQELATMEITSINVVVGAVDQVRTDAEALQEIASETLTPEIQAFLVTVDDSRRTISSISNRQLREELKDVRAAVGRVSSAASELETKVKSSEC